MFWGLVLEPCKKYTQKVDQTFHISQASLDLKSCDQEPIQLLVEYENSNFVLATLCKKANIFQVPLDLMFKTGDQVSFRTIGNGKVHLSGYHVLEDVDGLIMNGEEESDLDEMEIFEQTKGKRKTSSLKSKGNKKVKLTDENEKESDDDDDDDGDDYDYDEEEDDEEDEEESHDEENERNVSLGKTARRKKGKVDSSIISMDDDEDDDESEDDEDDEDDFDLEEEEDEDIDDIDMDDSEDDKMHTPKSQKKKNKTHTPNGIADSQMADSRGKEKSTQKQNKNKDTKQQGTPGKEGKTPKSESKPSKNEKYGKNSDAGSTPQRKGSDGMKNAEKTPKTPKQEGSPQKKVLEGGVISEEIVVGDGPIAKPGKMVNVYYVGTLASTKKQFDSVQGGPGFKFRLGRNEVIKGWDIGVNGMKVGGKRKLTIPPHLGYGSKGSPPVIPPNSTLVFTVELKGLC